MSRALAWLAAIAALQPALATAYSDADRFDQPAVDPVTETFGGSAGRRFTGSVADGQRCEVCHVDAGEPEWDVSGVPADGWAPGETSEITVQWPEERRLTAVALEIVDADGEGAGTLEALPEAELGTDERCPGDDRPAAQAFPAVGDRTVVASDGCGASRMRARWTAPPAQVGAVHLHAVIVQGDASGSPEGDDFGALARALPLRGTVPPEEVVKEGGCSAAGAPGGVAFALAAALWCLLLVRRHRTRPRTRAHGR